jgi:hypothetical protein
MTAAYGSPSSLLAEQGAKLLQIALQDSTCNSNYRAQRAKGEGGVLAATRCGGSVHADSCSCCDASMHGHHGHGCRCGCGHALNGSGQDCGCDYAACPSCCSCCDAACACHGLGCGSYNDFHVVFNGHSLASATLATTLPRPFLLVVLCCCGTTRARSMCPTAGLLLCDLEPPTCPLGQAPNPPAQSTCPCWVSASAVCLALCPLMVKDQIQLRRVDTELLK